MHAQCCVSLKIGMYRKKYASIFGTNLAALIRANIKASYLRLIWTHHNLETNFEIFLSYLVVRIIAITFVQIPSI